MGLSEASVLLNDLELVIAGDLGVPAPSPEHRLRQRRQERARRRWVVVRLATVTQPAPLPPVLTGVGSPGGGGLTLEKEAACAFAFECVLMYTHESENTLRPRESTHMRTCEHGDHTCARTCLLTRAPLHSKWEVGPHLCVLNSSPGRGGGRGRRRGLPAVVSMGLRGPWLLDPQPLPPAHAGLDHRPHFLLPRAPNVSTVQPLPAPPCRPPLCCVLPTQSHQRTE